MKKKPLLLDVLLLRSVLRFKNGSVLIHYSDGEKEISRELSEFLKETSAYELAFCLRVRAFDVSGKSCDIWLISC